MPTIEHDLNPVTRLTVDAIGEPGKRVFYIQGGKLDQVITLVVEKIQVQSLAAAVDEFLTEIANRYPDLQPPAADYQEAEMHILPPVDPLFRAGQLALAYDNETDRAILIAHEITLEDDLPFEENQGPEAGGDPSASDSASSSQVVRFWSTRSQILAMARWGLEVSSRGRPICPYCGQPIEPEGHFCPKKNGHKH